MIPGFSSSTVRGSAGGEPSAPRRARGPGARPAAADNERLARARGHARDIAAGAAAVGGKLRQRSCGPVAVKRISAQFREEGLTRLGLGPGRAVLASRQPFAGCEFPALDWAVTSTGRSGSASPSDAHAAGDHLFVATLVRSIDPDDAEGVREEGGVANYALTGPFSRADPTGAAATTKAAAFGSASEIALHVVDRRTGRPVVLFLLGGFSPDRTFGLDAAEVVPSSTTRLSLGGHFTGYVAVPETASCRPFEDGLVRVSCADDGATTLLEVDGGSNPETEPRGAFVLALDVNERAADEWNGVSARWATAPWHRATIGRVHHTAVDPRTGDVFAVGETCDGDSDALWSNCSGWAGRFAADDRDVVWTKELQGYYYVWGLELNAANGVLFFTGYVHDTGTKVAGCMRDEDGDLVWARTFSDSLRATRFTGEVKLAKEADGPYIYAAFNIDKFLQSESLDHGTPYAGCLDGASGKRIPAYDVVSDKFLEEADCTSRGYSFISPLSDEAITPPEAPSGVVCGTFGESYDFVSCVVKYHKFTGRPVWSSTVVMVQNLETSDKGPLILSAYIPRFGSFGGVDLPTGSPWTSALVQGLLDKDTGTGVYVHSFHDHESLTYARGSAQDDDGDLYLVGQGTSDKLFAGSEGLELKFPTTVDTTKGDEHWHLVVVKLKTGPGNAPITPSCVLCDDDGARSGIADDACYIDQVCYDHQTTALNVLGDASLICDVSVSQTEFLDLGAAAGDGSCNVCGAGRAMTNGAALYDASAFGYGEVSCGVIHDLGKAGELPIPPGLDCASLGALLGETCGCAAEETTAPTTAPAIPAAPAAEVASPAAGEGSDAGGLPAGALVGIVVGCVVVVALAGVAAGVVARRSRRGAEFDTSTPAIRAAIDAHDEDKRAGEGGSVTSASATGTQQSDAQGPSA